MYLGYSHSLFFLSSSFDFDSRLYYLSFSLTSQSLLGFHSPWLWPRHFLPHPSSSRSSWHGVFRLLAHLVSFTIQIIASLSTMVYLNPQAWILWFVQHILSPPIHSTQQILTFDSLVSLTLCFLHSLDSNTFLQGTCSTTYVTHILLPHLYPSHNHLYLINYDSVCLASSPYHMRWC